MRQAFALLTVLWVLAALGLVTADVLMLARAGMTVTRNRTTLVRAEWARDACEAILRARFANDSLTRVIDRVDLGSGVWCEATLIDVGTLGDRALTLRVDSASGSAGQPDALADRRVNLNGASDSVIAQVTGLSVATARQLIGYRRAVGDFQSLPEVLSAMPPVTARAISGRFSEFSTMVTLRPVQYIARTTGGVGASPSRAQSLLVLLPVGHRLVAIRRDEL